MPFPSNSNIITSTGQLGNQVVETADIKDANVTVAKIAPGNNGEVLKTTAGNVAWGTATSPVTQQVFTASGTWTKPAGLSAVIVEVVGGGGGGGGSSASNGIQGHPGNGGGYSRKRIAAASLGATETVTVGAGGTAGGATTDNAGTGGTTSFGAHCQATGGAGGKIGGSTSVNKAVGVGSGGDINSSGGCGRIDTTASNQLGYAGTSYFCGAQAGGDEGTEQAGFTGYNYGGGATGGNREVTTSQAGGVGGAGIVIVTEFY